MNLSLDEYRALIAKAFRGVGYSWGLTEDASWAARRLAEIDMTSPEAVLSLLDYVDASMGSNPDLQAGPVGQTEPVDPVLQRMPDEHWTCPGDALCPICVGTTLLDLGTSAPLDPSTPFTLGPTLAPELLIPFLAESLRSVLGSDPKAAGSVLVSDPEILVDWDTGSCAITRENRVFSGARTAIANQVTVIAIVGSDPHPDSRPMGSDPVVRNTRVVLEPLQYQRLEELVHRIYAPATDESRDGAGAGLTDND